MNVRKIGMLAMVITVITSCKKDQVIDDGGVVVLEIMKMVIL